MEHLSTLELAYFHVENCSLRNTPSFSPFKKSRKRIGKFTDIPFELV